MRRVVIKVCKSHSGKLDSVQKNLASHGFILLESLPEIDVLLGECPDDVMEKLERVAGVSLVVEDQKTFKLLKTEGESNQPPIRGTLNGRRAPSLTPAFEHDSDPLDALMAKYSRFDTSVEYAHANRGDNWNRRRPSQLSSRLERRCKAV